ncbi:hypothetical protein BH20VER1_BH20VER1_31280 [soil metagenome]
MSTLEEIEAAAASLPLEQQQQLLRFLASRTRTDGASAQLRLYSDEEIARMLDEDEGDARGFERKS